MIFGKIPKSTIYFLFFITVAEASFGKCGKELVHGWGDLWEPFLMGTPQNPSGFDNEVLDAMIGAAGCTLKHTNRKIPWPRVMMYIKTGKLDIVASATKTEKRSKFAYFTDPYRGEIVALFVLKENVDKFNLKEIDDLLKTNFALGIEREVSYGKRIDAILEAMSTKTQDTSIDVNAQKLLKGRIDGYLSYIPTEPIALKKLGFEKKIVMHPMTPVNTGDIHFMISKQSNSPEIVKALNKGLRTIKKNGVYDGIVKKYSQKYGVSKW